MVMALKAVNLFLTEFLAPRHEWQVWWAKTPTALWAKENKEHQASLPVAGRLALRSLDLPFMAGWDLNAISFRG